jgi:xanthine phosphoribosyltransferase
MLDGMTPLAFRDIAARLDRWNFPAHLDGVVAIAGGGVVPAALVAQRLGLEMKIIALNYRDEANEPRFAEPKLLSAVPDVGGWKRILLVDDVYVSGKSWHAARALLPAAVEVLPFVLKGKVDFALIRDVDGCVLWPWRVASGTASVREYAKSPRAKIPRPNPKRQVPRKLPRQKEPSFEPAAGARPLHG